MLGLLHHRIRQLRADELAAAESGALETTSMGTLPDAISVHQALARNEEKTFAVSIYAAVGAESSAELQRQAELFQSSCRRMMVRAVQPFFQIQAALLASLPFGLDRLARDHVLNTAAVSTLLPWLREDLADPDGHYWGYNKETAGLVVFDPFDESRFPNANIAVLAHSGAGKSYAAASLVLSGFTRGVGAIIFDPEAEYGRMIRSLGGTYLRLAAGSAHAINILDSLSLEARTDEGEERSDSVQVVLDLIALMCGRLDEVERAELEAALRSLRVQSSSMPVLADLWSAIESSHPGSRVARVLTRWVHGDLGRLFSRPTNVDLNADIVGFNLRDLQEEVVAPAYFVLANWLWSRLRTDRRPRHVLIDEAGLLLEHEPIRRFLIRLARRIRKYRGSLILVSQNPGDFFETKDGAVLAANPSIHLLGSQKHSEAVKLQKAFSLTDRQLDYLETAQRGDFLLLAGATRLPLHIMAPPWMDELIAGPDGGPAA
jgi:type IV secretory pathway VirB4 component